ncbi:hypothetical protein COX69_01240 [Candidatus Falkowbacteria bacterium CG_4_10_14_0_2_um_filter_48_10]|nr:MAG: hypothetical protein COX69_01240 [Candidatus Falkowbacteria bacterium CG_4_10_14_0_2_um_filter_48_10]
MIKAKDILPVFLELIAIDPSGGQEKKLAQAVLRRFAAAGCRARPDRYGNVLAFLPGQGEALLYCARLDAAGPGPRAKPLIKGDLIRSAGAAVLGADSMAGTAAMLAAAQGLHTKKAKHRPLEMVFTRRPEAGLSGAGNLPFHKLRAKEALVIEAAGPLGRIVTAAPHIYHLDIVVKGRSADAGWEPEKGLNAIRVASRAIAEIRTGRITKTVTNNIALISGGHALGIVPDRVEVKAETRALSLKEAQAQADLIIRAFKKQVRLAKAGLYLKTRLAVRGYAWPARDEFIKSIIRINHQLGLVSSVGSDGGLSDANILAEKKIKAVAISAGTKNRLTARETIRVSELVKIANFLAAFAQVIKK